MRIKLLIGAACLTIAIVMTTYGRSEDSRPKTAVAQYGVTAVVDSQPGSPSEKSTTTAVVKQVGDVTTGVAGGSKDVFRGSVVPRPDVAGVSFTGGPMRARTVTDAVQRVVYEPLSAEELTQNKVFFEAKQALKNAKSEEEKKHAAGLIVEHLVRQFDKDLAQREKELASLEERLKLLREQLEKRKVSKEEIVNLRIKTVLNDAEGLGFPGDETSGDVLRIVPNHPTVVQPGALQLQPLESIKTY